MLAGHVRPSSRSFHVLHAGQQESHGHPVRPEFHLGVDPQFVRAGRPPACPGRDRTVVVVAPRVSASAPVNSAEDQMTLAGSADTITPALWA